MEKNIPDGLRFTLLHRAFRRQLGECVREYGLTGPQFVVLGTLGRLRHDGEQNITQKMLEDHTHISHATITELLKKLESKGFIESCVNETDRRCKVISGTDKCESLHQTLEESGSAIFAKLCEGLSQDDVKNLLRITDVMIKNAEALPSPDNDSPMKRSKEP